MIHTQVYAAFIALTFYCYAAYVSVYFQFWMIDFDYLFPDWHITRSFFPSGIDHPAH